MNIKQSIRPVILSGGSGKRLWPLSRKERPKQFLSLVSELTMLQETISRLSGLKNILNPIIVCNSDHRFFVAEQCKQIGIIDPIIILEPVSRNTAPAITAAAIYASMKLDDSMLLVLSADHSIQDINAFHNAIDIAKGQARHETLVVFGVNPKSANTNYGYIKLSTDNKLNDVNKIESFIEKPNLKKAKSFIQKGGYLWNSGMFMFSSNTILKELKKFVPEMVNKIEFSVDNAIKDLDFIRLDKNSFSSTANISIDYAVIEKSNNVVAVTLNAGWSDIGSWPSLYNIGEKDSKNNVIQGDAHTEETFDTYVFSSEGHLIVTNGIKDLVIVNTPDITLISGKNESSSISKIIDKFSRTNLSKVENNRKVYRPWGWYDSLDSGKNFHVKRIHIYPEGKLSLQSHSKRAEHWIVIKGEAHTLINDETKVIGLNQSIFVPINAKHSLENRDKESYLEIIEVQSGTYFGEDDIIRFEDVYGRIIKGKVQ